MEDIGYQVLHGPEIAPDADAALRHGWDQAFLDEVLDSQAVRLNPDIPRSAVDEVLKRLKQHEAIDLVSRNRQAYRVTGSGEVATGATVGRWFASPPRADALPRN